MDSSNVVERLIDKHLALGELQATAEQAMEDRDMLILDLKAAGWTLQEIGDLIGMTKQAISLAVNRAWEKWNRDHRDR